MGQFLGNSSSLFSHSMGHRDWWRDYFYDHPLLAQKASQAYSNTSKDKPKVFCKQCWATAVTAEIKRDEEDVLEGRRAAKRDQAAIEASCK
jgi:hypothetical protein